MMSTTRRSLREEIAALMRGDSLCGGIDDALRTIGLVAFAGGISRVSAVRDHLCIKGGTLLRLMTKGAIGRPPSKDLDATLMDAAGFSERIIEADVADAANALLRETFRERCLLIAACIQRPPPTGNGVSTYAFQLTMEASGLTNNPNKVTRATGNAFKFDLCDDELVLRDLVDRLQGVYYGMPLDVLAYAPLQSLAEKLRAILQKHQHFDVTGAAGSFAPRHVLDLEIIYPLLAPGDLDRLADVFHQKCEARGVPLAQRTRDRLMNPILEGAVRAECQRLPNRSLASCWGLLGDLVGKVVR